MKRLQIKRSTRHGGECDHGAIIPTSLPLTGRCLECGALVDTPFELHRSAR